MNSLYYLHRVVPSNYTLLPLTMDDTKKVYPQAVAIPLLSIIAICIVITPMVLHAKNKNFPAWCILFWFILLNLFNIINAFIWPTDDIDSWWDGAGLCDIEVKVMIASYVAVPGGLVCVFRSLARVLDTRCATLVPTKEQRWWNRGMEMLFCVFVPAASMVTHIVYQKSRYMIYAVSGCINNFDDSAMSLALAFIWPPVICLIACYYCGMPHPQLLPFYPVTNPSFLGLVLYRLHMYRSQFGEILHASNSRMNKSRFLRLFFLNFTMLLIILPIQCFVVYYNTWLSFPWHTYTWSAVHSPEWGVIVKVPTHGQAFFDRWVPIAASCLVFVFFGCGKDANELYRAFLRFLGLGRCFPCILPENRRASMAGSTGSRVRLLFHKRWSSTSRYVSLPFSTIIIGNTSLTNIPQNLREQHPRKRHKPNTQQRCRKRPTHTPTRAPRSSPQPKQQPK